MSRPVAHAALCTLALAAAAVAAGLGARRGLLGATPPSAARAGRTDAGDVVRAAGDAAPATAVAIARDAGDVPRAAGTGAVWRALDVGARGTYIAELLLERDSALARWPERVDRPLTVWVQPAPALAGWRPAFAARAREAFAEWGRVGLPLRFAFVDDSASADVHVSWVDRFDEPISGRTLWARDDRWWIVSADVVLALHHRDGAPLDESAMRAIALHEVGHLVGLDHTRDAANIMTPRVHVRDLSAADRATARLLYSVPPGRVR